MYKFMQKLEAGNLERRNNLCIFVSCKSVYIEHII